MMPAKQETKEGREDFYERIASDYLAPLWEVLKSIAPAAPTPQGKPHVWQWQQLRSHLIDAGGVVTAEEAERRVLVLENPAFPGQSRATSTLYAGVQLVLPGEIAPAHRHTQSALRFILESDGGYTAVDGERTTMHPGDFVITPSWTFHDHGNDTSAPVLWLDVLDLPLVSFLGAGFSQPHDSISQQTTRPEGDSLARFGHTMLPMNEAHRHGITSPLFNYPYVRTRPALIALAGAEAPDRRWGYALRYSNPADGGWAIPTISSWIAYLPRGFRTTATRSTDGLIAAVVEGSGRVRVGDEILQFRAKDILAIPNWCWREFSADEDSIIFFCSDRVVGL